MARRPTPVRGSFVADAANQQRRAGTTSVVLFGDLLGLLIALDDRGVVRRQENIELRDLGRFRAVPRAVDFGQRSVVIVGMTPLSLPQGRWQVLTADLNCSDSA